MQQRTRPNTPHSRSVSSQCAGSSHTRAQQYPRRLFRRVAAQFRALSVGQGNAQAKVLCGSRRVDDPTRGRSRTWERGERWYVKVARDGQRDRHGGESLS